MAIEEIASSDTLEHGRQKINTNFTELNTSKENSASKGIANGYAELDSSGIVPLAQLPPSITENAPIPAIAGEDLTAGIFVNLYNDGDVLKVRKASSAAVSTMCIGYIIADVSEGESTQVYYEGNNNFLTNLTIGAKYFLSTNGLVSSTPPSGSGVIIQFLGIAIYTTTIQYQFQDPIVLL